jgi:hypothetical protein
MFISTLSSPIYVSALLAALFKRRGGFTVTSKGASTQRDSYATFARHLRWAAAIAVPLTVSLCLGADDPWMYLWSLLALVVCLLPVAIWRLESPPTPRAQTRRARRHDALSDRAGAFAEQVEIA